MAKLKAAEEKARREAEEKARQEAAAKAKREAEEKIRQAQALARLRQQEEAAARAKAAADEDSTVAIGSARAAAAPPSAPVERNSSYAIPAAIGAAVVAAGVGAFFFLGRTPAPAPVPAPVAQAPAPLKAEAPAPVVPPKAELSAADVEKIRKETEERIRREYADKSAAEQGKAMKAAAEKAVQEKQLAAKAVAEKAAQEKVLAAKAATEKAATEKLAAERAAGEKAAAEKAARVAAEKAAEEKAAAAKAAEERAAAAAKAPPVGVASAAPGTTSRQAGLAGRYAFRFSAGGGASIACERLGFQEDIEVRGIGSSISGSAFSGLEFLNASDGQIAARVTSVAGGRFTNNAKLSGRATAAGYAGTYDWGTGNQACTGQWTLVRRGEAAAEAAVVQAKATTASGASTAPAAAPREAGLAGAYAFRMMMGSGFSIGCSSIDVQDDIEIRPGSVQGISGKGFSNLRIQSAPDGAVAATAQGIWTRAGTIEVKLTGRATATGYAGIYEGRTQQAYCTGQWTLVRK